MKLPWTSASGCSVILLSLGCVSGVVLGTRDPAGNKIATVPVLMGLGVKSRILSENLHPSIPSQR